MGFSLLPLWFLQIRGSKLHNRVSAPPPPLQAGTFSRGVVTMRCDLSTCSSAHISLLVSGSAQTCLNDQAMIHYPYDLLESYIKNELIEKSQLVHAVPSCEESKLSSSEPRRSASIACGASVFEVRIKVPTWASQVGMSLQVLRQLAPDVSYRSLVTLGIASIQGLSVASFEKDDADRLLFFCTRHAKQLNQNNSILPRPPSWLIAPPASRKRSGPCHETKPSGYKVLGGVNGGVLQQKPKIAAMRPIPHTRNHKMLPFSGISEASRCDGDQAKGNLSVVPAKHNGTTPVTHRKLLSSSFQAQQIISLNPLPLKKHGCGRSPIQICSEFGNFFSFFSFPFIVMPWGCVRVWGGVGAMDSGLVVLQPVGLRTPPLPIPYEEEFLRDVMQFLILRGHTRLVPQGGLAEFPDAILNAKRLDLYNLYREVVSRGGFHVGNGINWKGQVFSKMRNHTLTNRMTITEPEQ
ncbi:AT-rich interactive domain-containing protein 4 [Vitis vinifera]|uniref:AT-rich interactive domain-containing protein 4 n=1 Tax=Vitis vinifera TaxID=29760 RepID=A0A438GXX0_VITVI|nr:AT-rich interactive domain-containing protein 4 [Vitis vinifera]